MFKFEVVKDASSENTYKVYVAAGVCLGKFLMKEDGYYDFWPDSKPGYWPSYLLKALAKELDKLNADWDKQLREDPAING